MKTTRHKFQEIKLKGVRRFKDPDTGKPRQRTKIFMQTLNPFNKKANGQVKTSDDIIIELRAERNAWLALDISKIL